MTGTNRTSIGGEPDSVGVVGAGLMGTGIAEVAATAGLRTVLVRRRGADIDATRARLARSLAALVGECAHAG